MDRPEEKPEEPLRKFLREELAASPVELEAGWLITDAIVLFRVCTVEDAPEGATDHIQEWYQYTVTRGVNFAMARGMMEICSDQMMDYYMNLLGEGDD